ncbi:peptidoglycan-binding protein [Streptomyces broussonetiae]|uniref:peptidoglycan-binding protein n=1 Tax=Streptomyces broussonetiae TaxID=2686304 RepID=UPI0035DB7511
MSESEGPEGHTCPECGAPRGPDRSPSCDCTARAAEALRETRTAEAAAAGDFDPLRIRPYVEVSDVSEADGVRETGVVRPVEATLPLRAVPGPDTADLGLFEDGETDAAGETGWADGAGPRRRRSGRRVVLSVVGAGAVVAAAAGFVSGLFSYDVPSRDGAAQEVRQSVPDVTTSAPASPTAPNSSGAVSRSLVRPPTAAASPSPSTTPSASPTRTAPSPSTSGPGSATPSATVSSAAPQKTPATAEPVLRRGDTGPEVTELQQRLRQLNLYDDEINGVFTRPVQDAVRTYQLARGIIGDTYGEYGPATRASLEAETSQP